MIYTVTLNPSIDYIVHVSALELGELNRMDGDTKLPGGKGINVSRVLHRLGHPTTALGFLGGFTGQFVEDWIKKEGVGTDFVHVQGDTRINVKVKSDQETELNAKGPNIDKREADKLLQQVHQLKKGDILVLSGNKPPALPEDFYQQLIQICADKGAEFVIDTTGQELMDSLSQRPLLVKPNNHELADLFQTQFQSVSDIVPYAKKLVEKGAKYAVISMAGEGALFVSEKETLLASVPKGSVKNSVGAGDSMIAGFLGTFSETSDPIEAFRTSVATGSATAFSDDLAEKTDIDKLISDVRITSL